MYRLVTYISILCLALHADACTYFQGAEFRAKAPHFKTDVAPEHCKREVDEYTRRSPMTPLPMVDSNGGLYYCTKRCASLCPSRSLRRMLYVKCDPFRALARRGAAAADVAFACRCKHAGKPGFCEVPQTTWDQVEKEYIESCTDLVSPTNSTSTASITTSTTATIPTTSSTSTTTIPTTTAPTTTATTTATTTTSTTPTTSTTSSPTTVAATTPATATPTTTAEAAAAPTTTTSTTGKTTRPTPPTTPTQSASATSTSGPPWESLSGTLAGGHRMLYTNLTAELCESQCAEWQQADSDGDILRCRAFVYFEPVLAAQTDKVVCTLYSRTRHASPSDYVAKPSEPTDGPGGHYGAVGRHKGTYTYVGVCDGGEEQCGVQWTAQ